MDPHPEIKSALKSEWENKPVVIPPPDLFRPPTPPPLPISSVPPLPQTSGEFTGPYVKVKLHDAADFEDDDSSAGQVATFNTRAVAAIIDLLVGLGVNIGLAWILPDFAGRLAQLAGMAYFVTRDSLPFLDGQSVGKKAMKLKVTTLDGSSISENWTAALIRNGVLLIPFFFLVEMFILLTRESGVDRGRRLGDEWAKTRVIIQEPEPDADSR